MDEPFTKWYCDTCGETIDVKKGRVIWNVGDHGEVFRFRIVHEGKCAKKVFFSSIPLKGLLGDIGIARLLSFLTPGPLTSGGFQETKPRVIDFGEYVDIFRRLHVPYYEEARRHFFTEDVGRYYSTANEILPYLPQEMADMMKKFG